MVVPTGTSCVHVALACVCIQVASMRGQKVMDNFYGRLKETWSYHTHHPGLPVNVCYPLYDGMPLKCDARGEEDFFFKVVVLRLST